MAISVSGAFTDLLTRLRLTEPQSATAATRVTGIKAFLNDHFTMAEAPFTIGSYRRGTIIRPERDLDILAPFSYSHYKARYDNDSRALLYLLRDRLNDGYATTTVSARQVAVRLDFSVIRADVVPAFRRDGGGYFIPNGKNRWSATNPAYHTRLITDRNQALENMLTPLIRIIKFWNLQNGAHLTSFHTELMVWRMWREAKTLPTTYAKRVESTLVALPSWVRSEFHDPWEAGGRIDGYLSAEERARVVRMLDQDAKGAKSALELEAAGKLAKAFDAWNSIFRHGFPALD